MNHVALPRGSGGRGHPRSAGFCRQQSAVSIRCPCLPPSHAGLEKSARLWATQPLREAPAAVAAAPRHPVATRGQCSQRPASVLLCAQDLRPRKSLLPSGQLPPPCARLCLRLPRCSLRPTPRRTLPRPPLSWVHTCVQRWPSDLCALGVRKGRSACLQGPAAPCSLQSPPLLPGPGPRRQPRGRPRRRGPQATARQAPAHAAHEVWPRCGWAPGPADVTPSPACPLCLGGSSFVPPGTLAGAVWP